MKKTVSFKKDIPFKSNIADIISIALDHDLKLEGRVIKGNLIVSGSYKMNDVSINTEDFKYNIPANIEMSDKYILDNLNIMIEDFYYEIIDNKFLSVDIEIGLDNLEEKKIEPKEEKLEVKPDETEERAEEPINRNIPNEVKELFMNFDDHEETYATYQICIIKEGDTIEEILTKYGIDREVLDRYNDLTEINIGDKLIIPAIFNENN